MAVKRLYPKVKGQWQYYDTEIQQTVTEEAYFEYKTREYERVKVGTDTFYFTDSFSRIKVNEIARSRRKILGKYQYFDLTTGAEATPQDYREYQKIEKTYRRYKERKLTVKKIKGVSYYRDSFTGYLSPRVYKKLKKREEEEADEPAIKKKDFPIKKPYGTPLKPKREIGTRTRFKYCFVKFREFVRDIELDSPQYREYDDFSAGGGAEDGTFSIEEMALSPETAFASNAQMKFFMINPHDISGEIEYIVYEVNPLYKANQVFGIQGKTIKRVILNWSIPKDRKIILYLASLRSKK